MTAFDDVFASAMESFDGVFGEAFTLSPRRSPAPSVPGGAADVNARRVADPGRAGFDFNGAFTSVPSLGRLEGRGGPAKDTTPSVAPRPTIDASRIALAYLPQEGDLVTRLKTGEVFKIGKETTDADGRTVLSLIEMQSAA